jgi:hypothetical protein
VKSALLVTMLSAVVCAGGLQAHHGSAEYDVTREITVRGTIVEWRWINPHVRVVVDVPGATGGTEVWDCEGPPLTWAAERGWSGSTLRKGETVALVMYPPKQNARTGLIKRIARSGGEVLQVSRPWLDNP